MQKSIILLLAAVLLASCSGATDNTSSKTTDTVTINGTWTWATIQGAPASTIGFSGTMVIVNGATYTWTYRSQSNVTETGTVALKSGAVYTLTPTSGTAIDYTLSADGKTISGNHAFFGSLTFTK